MAGEEVKKVRDSLGLTQREFADRCGVKVRTVQYWEANGVSGQQEIVIKSLLSDGAKFASYQSGSVHGPGSASVAGNGNNVNAGDALFRAFDEIA
jgi:DNA-binding XRE family transcriptional regulator